MTNRTRRRLAILAAAGLGLALAAALVLTALKDSMAFFYAPSEIARAAPGRPFRLGGLVQAGSVTKDGLVTSFNVTDLAATLPVRFSGMVPDLFREGQGVVAMGTLGPDGVFEATELLAKHDEKYMPPEVAESLKRNGHPGGQATP